MDEVIYGWCALFLAFGIRYIGKNMLQLSFLLLLIWWYYRWVQGDTRFKMVFETSLVLTIFILLWSCRPVWWVTKLFVRFSLSMMRFLFFIYLIMLYTESRIMRPMNLVVDVLLSFSVRQFFRWLFHSNMSI
jgi:hypothetical protein